MARMLLWDRIALLPELERSMKLYYDELGLLDIRVHFAQWIEERIMINTEDYEQNALKFYEDLKLKLVALGNHNNSLHKTKIDEICTFVLQTSALELYSNLYKGLKTEYNLVQSMPETENLYMQNSLGAVGGSAANGLGIGSVSGVVMNEGLIYAVRRIHALNSELDQLQVSSLPEQYHALQSSYTQYTQNKQRMSTQELIENDLILKQQEEQLHVHYSTLSARKDQCCNDLQRHFVEYDAIQKIVIDELRQWQRLQALAGNGAHFVDNLDDIQRCIEMLVELVDKIITEVTIMETFNKSLGDNSTLATELLARVRYAQSVLVLSAFIVEKQPPQVMKTNTRFSATVRWLIGPQLNFSTNTPLVECVILSEAQAQRHSAQSSIEASSSGPPPSAGEISNNSTSMEYQPPKREFQANFRNMQLKKIKRAEKKGTESVMDEKFALLFYASSASNHSYRIRVWTLSLPVVVIVHGNQEPQSWATITWDNAFSDIRREPFQVPERVSWSQLSSALNTKFASNTQRPLTEDNLNYIHEKLFRNDGGLGDHKDYITWAQFCKEPLPDRSFTFWDWFYAIMKLTKEHLLSLWKEGLVVGFINKGRAMNEILPAMNNGTFLLRFSDSELGGITIGLKSGNDRKVVMLSPWTARDLNIRGLADRVNDLGILQYIYPCGRLKDEAFGQFYTHRMEEQTTRGDGYVANTIRAHVPAIEGDSQGETPHHMQSPHPHDIQMSNTFTTTNTNQFATTTTSTAFTLLTISANSDSSSGASSSYDFNGTYDFNDVLAADWDPNSLERL